MTQSKPSRRHITAILGMICAVALAFAPAGAAVLDVPGTYSRITDALAAAVSGDSVVVAAGLYSPSQNGEVFPLAVTEDLSLLGSGFETCSIDAESTATVIRITATGQARVSGFTITGGSAYDGGGLWVSGGSAEIDSNLILDNGALHEGCGIQIDGGADHWVHHNVLWGNYDRDLIDFGDPHGIQINGISARIEHNVLGRGDSNALFFVSCEPKVRNNIFFENGIPGVRGRGICNFGGTATVIAHNVFFGNAIAALLVNTPSGFVDLSAADANVFSPTDSIFGNIDADPLFVDADNFDWHLLWGSPAMDAGDPALPPDPDATLPDVGVFFFDQSLVGIADGKSFRPPALRGVPNPFRQATTLTFTVERPARARLSVFDLRGRKVRTFPQADLSAGSHSQTWDGRNDAGTQLPAGVYFISVQSDTELLGAGKVVRR